MGIFWLNDSLEECFSFQEQVMTCSYSHLSHRMAVKAVGKKTGVIHLGARCHRELIITPHAQIIKKPRTGADEPDQERLKN